MLSLTEKQLLEHMIKHKSTTIAWETDDVEVQFYSKYTVGDTWLLGEVYGVIESAEYFNKASPKLGIIKFDFSRYDVKLIDKEKVGR